MKEFTYTIEEIDTVAEQVNQFLNHKVVLFYGEMGAGKTTFIKSLSNAKGVNEPMGSPTFSLVNEYLTTDNIWIYHFDMYRIKNESEAVDIGFEDYIYSGNWCFIEWAEKIPNLLPLNYHSISIEKINETTRLLRIN